MSPHVSEHDLYALRSGTLSPERVSAVARHLGECPECRALAGRLVDVDREVEHLSAAFGEELSSAHPDVQTELAPYVEGTLPDPEREIVDAHLEDCDVCREDVADIRKARQELTRFRWPWRPALAAAALLFTGFLVPWLWRTASSREAPDRQAPAREPGASTELSRPPAPVLKPAWQRAIAEARASQRLDLPDRLRKLGAADVFRGDRETGSRSFVSPARTAIDEERPEFRWTGLADATYVVEVFDSGTLVVRSGPLHATAWTPPEPLRRGRTYTWQVVATRGGERLVLPAPPAPAAMFELVDSEAHEDLGAARRDFPDDHLLLGVLYARAGIREAALRELRMNAERNPTDEIARGLYRSVEGWK